MKLIDCESNQESDGQLAFVKRDTGKPKTKKTGNEWCDPDMEARFAPACDVCNNKTGLPHKLDGEYVRLKPVFHDGDKTNKTRGNVYYLCHQCLKTLPKKANGK